MSLSLWSRWRNKIDSFYLFYLQEIREMSRLGVVWSLKEGRLPPVTLFPCSPPPVTLFPYSPPTPCSLAGRDIDPSHPVPLHAGTFTPVTLCESGLRHLPPSVTLCEGGLRQQRNDGGGCATMRERPERVESPGTYITEWVSRGYFCLALYSFGPPSRALVVTTWRGEGCRYMMRLG